MISDVMPTIAPLVNYHRCNYIYREKNCNLIHNEEKGLYFPLLISFILKRYESIFVSNVIMKIGMIDMISAMKTNSIVYGIEILFLPV